MSVWFIREVPWERKFKFVPKFYPQKHLWRDNHQKRILYTRRYEMQKRFEISKSI